MPAMTMAAVCRRGCDIFARRRRGRRAEQAARHLTAAAAEVGAGRPGACAVRLLAVRCTDDAAAWRSGQLAPRLGLASSCKRGSTEAPGRGALLKGAWTLMGPVWQGVGRDSVALHRLSADVGVAGSGDRDARAAASMRWSRHREPYPDGTAVHRRRAATAERRAGSSERPGSRAGRSSRPGASAVVADGSSHSPLGASPRS